MTSSMMTKCSVVPILSPVGTNNWGVTRPSPVIASNTEHRGKVLVSQHPRDFSGTGSDDLCVLTVDHFIDSEAVLVHENRHVTPRPLKGA